jgi:hypothetical protein
MREKGPCDRRRRCAQIGSNARSNGRSLHDVPVQHGARYVSV